MTAVEQALADLRRLAAKVDYMSQDASLPLPSALELASLRCQLGEVRAQLDAVIQSLAGQDAAQEIGSDS
jgi:hypothetical protein